MEISANMLVYAPKASRAYLGGERALGVRLQLQGSLRANSAKVEIRGRGSLPPQQTCCHELADMKYLRGVTPLKETTNVN